MSDLANENQRLRAALASLIAAVDAIEDDVLERRIAVTDAEPFDRLFNTSDRALRVLQGAERRTDPSEASITDRL